MRDPATRPSCFIKNNLSSLDFDIYYFSKACLNETLANQTDPETGERIMPCQPENTLQFLILMFTTVWLAVKIHSFKST